MVLFVLVLVIRAALGTLLNVCFKVHLTIRIFPPALGMRVLMNNPMSSQILSG